MASELQIVVEGEYFDLFDGEIDRFYLTKQVHDLVNLETRDSDFSKTIDIPLTPQNVQILDNALPTLDRFNPLETKLLPCQVLIKGVPVIADAFILIGVQDQSNQSLSITVYGGASKFFNQLKPFPISFLDFGQMEWTLAGIAPIMNTSTGIIFAENFWYTNPSRRLYEAQLGDDTKTFLNDIELGESGFCIYLKTVLDAIFANLTDLTVDYSALDAKFHTYAMQVPVPIVHDSYGAIEGTFEEVSAVNWAIPQTVQPALNDIIEYPTLNTPPAVLWNPATNQFEFTESGFYIVRSGFTGTKNAGVLSFRLLQNFGLINQSQVAFIDFASNLREFSGAIDTSVNVVAGDTVGMYTSYGNVGGVMDTGNFSIEAQGTGRGRTINIGEMLPSDITQKDFVKEVFKLQNIVPIEENTVIKLKYWGELSTRESKTIGINKFFPTKFKTTLASYAQENIFKYTTNPEVERLDSFSSFRVNSQTLDAEVVKILSAFSATDISTVTAGATFPTTVVPNYEMEYQFISDNKVTVALGGFIYTTAERNTIKSGDFISIDHGGVIDRRRVVSVLTDFVGEVDVAWTAVQNATDYYHWFYSKQDVLKHLVNIEQNNTIGIDIWDGGTVQTYQEHRQSSFVGLLWNELSVAYYQLLIDAMYKPFVVQAWMDLSIIKYISLDGLEPIYVEEFDAYFYANKIEQWKYNGSTRVELIQIPI